MTTISTSSCDRKPPTDATGDNPAAFVEDKRRCWICDAPVAEGHRAGTTELHYAKDADVLCPGVKIPFDRQSETSAA